MLFWKEDTKFLQVAIIVVGFLYFIMCVTLNDHLSLFTFFGFGSCLLGFFGLRLEKNELMNVFLGYQMFVQIVLVNYGMNIINAENFPKYLSVVFFIFSIIIFMLVVLTFLYGGIIYLGKLLIAILPGVEFAYTLPYLFSGLDVVSGVMLLTCGVLGYILLFAENVKNRELVRVAYVTLTALVILWRSVVVGNWIIVRKTANFLIHETTDIWVCVSLSVLVLFFITSWALMGSGNRNRLLK